MSLLKHQQKRKATILADLKHETLEQKELTNGYAYKFKVTDEMIDKLSDFIKTERMCCSFFDFTLKL